MPDYPLGVLIKHIQIQIGKSLNHRLEQMNITGSQAHVLVFLMNRTGQRTTLRDLEEHLQQSHVTVTGLVQRLVQKGFVEAQVDERDRRCRLLTLTPQGHRHVESDPRAPAVHGRAAGAGLHPGRTGAASAASAQGGPKHGGPPTAHPRWASHRTSPHRALLTDFAGAGRKFILIPFIKRR